MKITIAEIEDNLWGKNKTKAAKIFFVAFFMNKCNFAEVVIIRKKMKNLFSVLLLTLLIAGCSSMRNNKAVEN
jgi:hypothetical protein